MRQGTVKRIGGCDFSLIGAKIAGADLGFWSGGPSGVLTPRGGALSPKFAQNRGFTLKIA